MSSKQIKYLLIGLTLVGGIFPIGLELIQYISWNSSLPDVAKGIYNLAEYTQSLEYNKAVSLLTIFSAAYILIISIIPLIFGWYGKLDSGTATKFSRPIIQILVFFGVIGIIEIILSLPIGYYGTFVLDTKYGFNTSTPQLFFQDIAGSIVIELIIGGILISLLHWFYIRWKRKFIFLASSITIFITIFLGIFSDNLILPLFNQLSPLPEGDLKVAIIEIAKQQDIQIEGIYIIDSSKRDMRSNAYVSGLGPSKKIVFYDTMIKNYTKDEIVAILTHEIGHMKLFHIQTNLFLSILKIIFFFYLLSYIIDDKRYSEALGSNRTNLQIGITAFGILMIPLIFILGTFDTIITRTQEYSADTYAITHNANPSAFKSALIKLEKESKSIVLPNPIYEFFTYTHPSLLKRIENIDKYTH